MEKKIEIKTRRDLTLHEQLELIDIYLNCHSLDEYEDKFPHNLEVIKYKNQEYKITYFQFDYFTTFKIE